MATPPPSTVFQKTDFDEDGLGTQEAIDKFFTQLNSFTQSTCANLNGGLTSQNLNAEFKTFTLKTPTSTTGAFANGLPYAEYYASAVQNITNNSMTTVNFDSKMTDTDNAVTTGSGWKFTVPTGKDGTYHISSGVGININNAGFALSSILKNGAEYKRGNRMPVAASATYNFVNSSPLKLVAGDTISIGAYQVTGATQALDPSSTINVWCSIQALSLANPPVLSCFPALVKPNKVTSVQGVWIAGIYDTATPTVVRAQGGIDWTLTNSGLIQINNIAGLGLGRTYTVTLYIAGK